MSIFIVGTHRRELVEGERLDRGREAYDLEGRRHDEREQDTRQAGLKYAWTCESCGERHETRHIGFIDVVTSASSLRYLEDQDGPNGYGLLGGATSIQIEVECPGTKERHRFVLDSWIPG